MFFALLGTSWRTIWSLMRPMDQSQMVSLRPFWALQKPEELLVEKNSVRDETELRGRTDNFKKVVFKPEEGVIVKPGDYVKVKLDDIRGWTIRGKLV